MEPMKSFPELQSVLFVEDDPDTQAAVRFALQELHQLHLRICSTAREALHAATDFPASVLLLDVMMPEIDGASLLAGLRQSDIHRSTPAIFLTSLVDAEDLRYYRSLGVAGVISKPFDPLTLGERIVAILRDSQCTDSAPPPMDSELGALQRVFERELPQRLMKIRDVLEHCRNGSMSRPDCAHLWELIEDLRNTASTYGHHAIARNVQRAEQAAAALVLSPARNAGDFSKIERELQSWTF